MQPNQTIEMFFDGECPLCIRETALLRRMDRKHRIQFTDIAAPEFDAMALGKTQPELMAQMHGRLADGTWVTGVEVFRHLYSAVGFGPVVWFTRLPIISKCLDLAYHVFARHRLQLTGRCDESCRIQSNTANRSLVE